MNPTSNETLSTFSESCGAGALQLNVLAGEGSPGTQRSFDQPFLVVGRSPDADLRIDSDQVSARHCYLQVIGGRLVSIDLDGQGGVLIDGTPQRFGWVTPVTQLQIGPAVFRVQGEGEGGEPRLHPLSTLYARTLPTTALEIDGVVGQTYGWRMSRALALIGRSTACQVRLMNPSISNFHAALVRTPSGVWIVDLLSREGLEVDGAYVRAARLEEGSACRLGTFTLRFCRGTLAPTPPRRSEVSRLLSAPASSAPQAANSAERSVLLAAPTTAETLFSLAATRSSNPAGGESTLRPTWNPLEPALDAPQQSIMMLLAQMLGTMHRDHMDLVKDELVEIRRLAEEMHALRVEIGQRPATEPAAPVPPEVTAAPAKGPVVEPVA
ncbi:FHA domain-containing protein, partial [Singulisphaera acidiphila]